MSARRVIFSRQAAKQLEDADTWWREHRLEAATTVRNEIAGACELLSAHAEIGLLVPGARGVRRLLLRATSYWLYYRATHDTIRVVRVWHTSRRTPRKL